MMIEGEVRMNTTGQSSVTDIKLETIYRYPIKSLAGQKLTSIDLQPGKGLSGDREWALANGDLPVADNGDWTACGAFERLTIRPEMAPWSGIMSKTSLPSLQGPQNQILRFDPNGHPIGSPPAPFARNIRLQRANNGYWDHADGTISIINLTTIEEISRLTGRVLDPLRFRGNLYIRAEPWAELGWLGNDIRLGDIALQVIRPIDRCRATSIEPGTGEIDMNMPAQLMRHAGHIFCGVYATVRTGGSLAPGASGSVAIAYEKNSLKRSAAQPTAPALSEWPRPAEIVDVVDETDDIRSFWLRDPMASLGALHSYKAAQHVRLHALDNLSTWRTYTISAVFKDLIRVTVKKDKGPGSQAVHSYKKGEKITISGPFGSMLLPSGQAPLIFLTAGIGITPTVAMMHQLAQTNDSRQIEVIHVSQSRSDAALWTEILALGRRLKNIGFKLFTSKDNSGDHQGRPDLKKIAWHAHAICANVVLCGPERFQSDTLRALEQAGVSNSSIFSEIFASPDVDVEMREPSASGPFPVTFVNSGIEANWTAKDGTLLDLAESHGIVVPSHCRAGLCGTCKTKIISGDAEALNGKTVSDQNILACCSVPLGPLTLDL